MKEQAKKEPSWGGDVCYKRIDLSTHIIESSVWVLSLILLWYIFNINKHINELYQKAEKLLLSNKITTLEHIIDKSISLLHFAMYIQIVYYKTNISSLINLIQPCHLVLLLEGIALFSNGPLGVLITVLILPTLTGTLLATLFPDTTGLEQPFERMSYWIQHILIQIVPLYMLLRKNSLSLELINFKTILIGLWILDFIHWTFYEIIDINLKVNVEFMLCPTGPMDVIFNSVPQQIVHIPTYRTLMVIVVVLVGIIISYIYYYLALLITKFISLFSKSSYKKKI
jgi:hypothetical protein